MKLLARAYIKSYFDQQEVKLSLGKDCNPKHIANVAEGFCAMVEHHQTDNGELMPTKDGWLRCSIGMEFKLVE